MMEVEFIVLSIALIILSLLAVYFGVKFVIGFVEWKKLRAIRRNVPDNKNNIFQKQCAQKANSHTETKRMQSSPFSISLNNPYNDKDEYKSNYPIPYPFGFVLITHIARIISRIKRWCNQKQIKPN